jgi:hypothetical protein
MNVIIAFEIIAYIEIHFDFWEGKMRMKRKNNRVIAFITIMTLIFNLLWITGVDAVSESVDIRVDQDDLLDVVLTLGKTDTDVTTVDDDLMNALTALGVPEDKIKIQAVEANEVSAGNTSSGWEIYDHTNFTDKAIQYYRPYYNEVHGNYTLNNHIAVSTGEQTNIDFYGYGAPAYKDFMYMPNDQFGKKIFDFTIQEGSFYDALNGAGFLFNTSMTSNSDLANRRMSGYLLFFQYPYGSAPTVYIYQFANIDVNAFHNNTSTAIQSYAGFTPLASFAAGPETTRVVKIEATADSLAMWYNGNPVTWTLNGTATTTQSVALPTDYGTYGFGPLVGYLYHGCGLHTHFTFNNVTMSTESTRRFSEVIREPEWRENSKRFIINAEDGAVADFSDATALGEILSRLGNEGIHYLGWGKNAADGQAFIQKNDSRGTFIDKTSTQTDTYSEQIDALAAYIYQEYIDSVENDTDWLIYGNPNSLTITPESEKTNTIDGDWPNGKWRIDHDENYFDNPTGVALYDDQYLNNLDISFVETGKYDVYYKDTLIKSVYVHRRPEAGFMVGLNESLQVNITDLSFDPDHQSEPDKGIESIAWAYRETTSEIWINGQPDVFSANKEYVIRQTVVDREGEAGSPYYRYVSTSSSSSAKPIAEFSITPGRLLTYQTETIAYSNNSYDPQGADIVESRWTISRNGSTVYTGATPKTDFSDAAAGTYKIVLAVRNESDIWSEDAARYLVVVRDTTAPEIACDTSSGTFNAQKSVKISAADETGGSGFSARYTVVDQSSETPKSWGSIGTNSVFNIALNHTGAWYIHVKAQDYAGNTNISTFGPFILADNQAPSQPVITADPAYTDGEWVTSDVTFSAAGSTDDFTADVDLDYYVSINGVDYIAGNSITLSSDGLQTVYFKTTDAAGNTSTVASRTIKIDQTAPGLPVCEMTSGGGNYSSGSWAIKPVSILLSGSTDADGGVFVGYEYRIDEGEWQEGSSATISADGQYLLEYRSFDEAGNRSATGSASILIDQTSPAEPTISIRTLKGGTVKKILNFLTFRIFFNDELEVTITTSDATSGIATLAWKTDKDAAEKTTGESSVTFKLPIGYKGNITAKSTDMAGNQSESAASDGIILETNKPTLSVAADASRIDTALDVAVVVRDSDAGIDTLRYKRGSEGWQTVQLSDDEIEPVKLYTLDLAFLVTGETADYYNLTIEATDLAGNTQTMTVNLLGELIQKKTAALPDPETATKEEIENSQEAIRDTKKLLDLLPADEKDTLSGETRSKLDDLLNQASRYLVIVSKDQESGGMADRIGTQVRVPELNDPNVNSIKIELKATLYTQENMPSYIESTIQKLKTDQLDLLLPFDIYLLKTVQTVDGESSSVRVSNEDITGNIIVRLPLPEELENRSNLQVVYIADDGQYTTFATELVVIDGQKYLEFETDHFSTYAVVAEAAAVVPTTGEAGPDSEVVFLIVAAALTIIVLIRRRLAKKGNEHLR